MTPQLAHSPAKLLSMPTHIRKHGSKLTQSPTSYLRMSLPSGWQSLFSARRAGRYWGLFDSMPTLRGKTAARNTPARKVAVAKRPYRKAQVTRAPRTRRKIVCPVCGEKVLNVQMGNHQRYKHPKTAPIAA